MSRIGLCFIPIFNALSFSLVFWFPFSGPLLSHSPSFPSVTRSPVHQWHLTCGTRWHLSHSLLSLGGAEWCWEGHLSSSIKLWLPHESGLGAEDRAWPLGRGSLWGWLKLSYLPNTCLAKTNTLPSTRASLIILNVCNLFQRRWGRHAKQQVWERAPWEKVIDQCPLSRDACESEGLSGNVYGLFLCHAIPDKAKAAMENLCVLVIIRPWTMTLLCVTRSPSQPCKGSSEWCSSEGALNSVVCAIGDAISSSAIGFREVGL